MQTRTGSLTEAAANIAVGFTINWCANMAILPLFGFDVTGGQAFGMGLIFTVISLVRSYVLRRWFNGLRFGNKPTSVGKFTVKVDASEVAKLVEQEAARLRRDLGMEHAP